MIQVRLWGLQAAAADHQWAIVIISSTLFWGDAATDATDAATAGAVTALASNWHVISLAVEQHCSCAGAYLVAGCLE
jgi:hypothetical protein